MADFLRLPMLGEPFDPNGELFIAEHCRPHWSQAGAVVFLTFRTADSIPREVVQRWDQDKQEWLSRLGCDPETHWSNALSQLSEADRKEFLKTFNRKREMFLDSCSGRCLLKRPELSKIVADSLLHFDGVRYRMGDFVVMPNHVHLFVAFATAEAMNTQCDSWLHYTAYRINQAIGERGRFWQREPFDHLVRSPAQYEHLRQYIAENPSKAGLRSGDYRYRRYGDSEAS